MRVHSHSVLLILMALLLTACATSKRSDGAAAGDVETSRAADGANGDHGAGITNPDAAAVAGPSPDESGTSARFQRVADGIHDLEQALVWADHDNGSDINWSDARNHCEARGPGWSLPSVAALRSLFDASGARPRTVTVHGKMYTVLVVTPMISLSTLFFWSGEQHGDSEAAYVDFVNGTDAAGTVVSNFARALCVRRA